MRTAAGIFTYIVKTVLPTFADRPSLNRAPDILAATCETLSNFCLGSACEMAIHNAITKAMSDTLIAKLCLAVVDKYSSCRMMLSRGLGQLFHNLDQSWNSFMQAKVHLYEGRARRFLAAQAQKDSNHGAAVAFLGAAKNDNGG